MPADKRKKSESMKERIARLKGSKYRIEVPYYTQDPDNRYPRLIKVSHFPPKDVSLYTFEEAKELLVIFCAKWAGNGQNPPPEIEPVAIEVDDDPRDSRGRRRRLYRFTLKEVDENQIIPLPPAPSADEDDDFWF